MPLSKGRQKGVRPCTTLSSQLLCSMIPLPSLLYTTLSATLRWSQRLEAMIPWFPAVVTGKNKREENLFSLTRQVVGLNAYGVITSPPRPGYNARLLPRNSKIKKLSWGGRRATYSLPRAVRHTAPAPHQEQAPMRKTDELSPPDWIRLQLCYVS